MSKQQQTLKKEQSSPTFEELYDYIDTKLEGRWEKPEIREAIDTCGKIIKRDSEGRINALLLYEPYEDIGHHITFFGADNAGLRKELVYEGLQRGVWPVSAIRKKKHILYKKPQMLISKLLEKN